MRLRGISVSTIESDPDPTPSGVLPAPEKLNVTVTVFLPSASCAIHPSQWMRRMAGRPDAGRRSYPALQEPDGPALELSEALEAGDSLNGPPAPFEAVTLR